MASTSHHIRDVLSTFSLSLIHPTAAAGNQLGIIRQRVSEFRRGSSCQDPHHNEILLAPEHFYTLEPLYSEGYGYTNDKLQPKS